MRVLTAPDGVGDDLESLYAFPDRPWVRANFVSTVDGAAVGPNGRSGSINNHVDQRVFGLQRTMADAVLIGSNTVVVEKYGRVPLPPSSQAHYGPTTLAVVSSSADLPPKLLEDDGSAGPLLLLTTEQAGASALAAARDTLGADNVWVVGDGRNVDLPAAVTRLRESGCRHVMAEGGPTLFGLLLQQGLVDEVALTWTPMMVGGNEFRMTHGPQLDVDLTLRTLLEHESTLLGLWQVRR